MNIKRLFLTGVFVLFTSPLALADEIGGGITGDDESGNASGTSSTAMYDEIGGGLPAEGTGSEETGSVDSIDLALAFWRTLLISF